MRFAQNLPGRSGRGLRGASRHLSRGRSDPVR